MVRKSFNIPLYSVISSKCHGFHDIQDLLKLQYFFCHPCMVFWYTFICQKGFGTTDISIPVLMTSKSRNENKPVSCKTTILQLIHVILSDTSQWSDHFPRY